MKDSTITVKTRKGLQNLAVGMFWLIIWQCIHYIVGRDVFVPSPFSVFNVLLEMIWEEMFWVTVFHSVFRVAVGILLSVIVGAPFGIAAGRIEWIYILFSPMVSIIKSTPVISFIIIALVWFKSTNVPIFIGFLMCFPIIWTNTVMGVRQVDRKLLQMAKIYQISKKDIMKEIYMPSLVPYMSAAIITALGLGWKVGVAAEVLSHPRRAIGSELHSAKAYVDTPSLFAWTLVVILLSLLFETVFAKLIRKWVRSTHFGSHRR
ncbi:MAG TPA: ABC transporter permease [Clostridiales bacterium UBA8960]|jgi:NitT/TauT family transport system permease protein|nr:ABC transporter permease [Clostridiales bacterium UBA8960]